MQQAGQRLRCGTAAATAAIEACAVTACPQAQHSAAHLDRQAGHQVLEALVQVLRVKALKQLVALALGCKGPGRRVRRWAGGRVGSEVGWGGTARLGQSSAAWRQRQR